MKYIHSSSYVTLHFVETWAVYEKITQWKDSGQVWTNMPHPIAWLPFLTPQWELRFKSINKLRFTIDHKCWKLHFAHKGHACTHASTADWRTSPQLKTESVEHYHNKHSQHHYVLYWKVIQLNTILNTYTRTHMHTHTHTRTHTCTRTHTHSTHAHLHSSCYTCAHV